MTNSVDLTPAAHKERCSKLEDLVERQKQLCSLHDRILPVSIAIARVKLASRGKQDNLFLLLLLVCKMRIRDLSFVL
jgi:hypothetical protein